MNGRYKIIVFLLMLCLLVSSQPASAGYAQALAASGYGFSGFGCLDASLGSWGWAIPLNGWGWSWPIF
jgi:hypothetical protein